jgi:hypothetical protein
MARPIGKRHQIDVRNKIRASMLINRLEACAEGKLDLDQVRVNAIKILLGKVLPDLTAISGDPLGSPLKGEWTVKYGPD